MENKKDLIEKMFKYIEKECAFQSKLQKKYDWDRSHIYDAGICRGSVVALEKLKKWVKRNLKE